MTQAARPTVVLFGGTFNPLHEGHLGIIQGLLRRPGVSRLLVIPTGRNPFKGAEPLLPVALRAGMVRAAVGHLPRVSVLELELQAPGPSYTIDTVTALARDFPEAGLCLALGWDVFREFPRWRDAPGILALASLWVILRAGTPAPDPARPGDFLAGLPSPLREEVTLDPAGRGLDRRGRVVVEFLELGLPDISSTEIRETHSLERVPPGARELLAAYWESGALPGGA